MADLNGAGSATLGGLATVASGQTQWWDALQDDPFDTELIPSTTYGFVIHVDTWDNGPIDVRLQISTSPTFSSFLHNALTTGVPETPNTTVLIAGMTNGTTYYWRVRGEQPSGSVGQWSTTRSFKVYVDASDAAEYVYLNVGAQVVVDADAAAYVYLNVGAEVTLDPDVVEYIYENVGAEITRDGDAVEYVYEGDVNTATPTPRIWFLMPGSGRAGDGIQIVGWGFGDLQSTYVGEVEVDYGGSTGWVSVPISSWQTFPADPPAYGPDRMLDPVTGQVDMQHTIITIVVPADAIPPGYPVRVKTNGP